MTTTFWGEIDDERTSPEQRVDWLMQFSTRERHLIACAFANRVLHYYEAYRPTDNRLKKALEISEDMVCNITCIKQDSVLRDAYDSAAIAYVDLVTVASISEFALSAALAAYNVILNVYGCTSPINNIIATTHRFAYNKLERIDQNKFLDQFVPKEFDDRWRTSDTVGVARGIYETKAFDRMGILFDALMDAGCDNEELLKKNDYHRGCFILDAILGLREKG